MSFAAQAASSVGSLLTNTVSTIGSTAAQAGKSIFMPDPNTGKGGVTWKTVGDLIGVLGTSTSAVGLYNEGVTGQSVREYNASILRNKAELFRRKAALDFIQRRKKAASFTATQIGAFAAAGVNPFSGSALEVLSQDAADMELDILIGLQNDELKARDEEMEANLEIMKGKVERNEGRASAGSTLLTQLPRYIPEIFDALGKLGSKSTTKPVPKPTITTYWT